MNDYVTECSGHRCKPFSTSPLDLSHTKGIWLVPQILTNPSTGRATILLDCEGLYDPEQLDSISQSLFILSVALGDVFLYNLVKKIDSLDVEMWVR